MTQYINKDVLVTEIEKLRKNACESFQKGNSTEEQYYIRYGVIQDILSFLDTLEVKEVDIRSEVSNWWNNHYTSTKKGYTFEGYSGHYLDNSTIVNLAQYFFELGLRTQKGE